MLLKRYKSDIKRTSAEFLNIGDFHLETVVISCMRTYLKSSAIQNLIVEDELLGFTAVYSIMNGGTYI